MRPIKKRDPALASMKQRSQNMQSSKKETPTERVGTGKDVKQKYRAEKMPGQHLAPEPNRKKTVVSKSRG
jgi:hypothetical protein